MKQNKWMFFSGIALIAVGVVALLRIPYFYYHSDTVGSHLLKQANALTGKQTQNATSQDGGTALQNVSLPKGLLGEVYIPALHLKAPLVEGTADSELAVGVGHLKASVMPGRNGTSVIAAHNATWFRHIDSLKVGDKVQVVLKSGVQTFQVTSHKVVREGSPVYNSANPTIVLETCYPTDALYLTPYRLLVYGKWETSGAKATSNITDSVNVDYQTKIPKRIVAQGITLTTNSLPMGKLTYSGNPGNKYVQGNAPLSASSAAVRLYLGWLHASAHRDASALQELTPMLKTNPLLGVDLAHISYRQHFNVKLAVEGTVLKTITATTELRTGTRSYLITMTCSVNGANVAISNLRVQKR